MKLPNIYIKLLAISGSLLISSIGQLSAMQSKQSESIYDTLTQQNYSYIWSKPAIQQATKGIEHELEHEKFDNILSKFHNKVMSFITNDNIKECSETRICKEATERFLKDFIKKEIITPKTSLEENMNNLIHDISKENEDIIFNLIIEDYTDKYIKNSLIDLQQIFNANEHPAGIMLHIVQQYHERIYEKLRLALVSLADYEYFEKKYTNDKNKYCEIISHYIIEKLTKALGNYFVAFVENNGWDAVLEKYKNGKHYIDRRLLPEIFDSYIIGNSISIYTLPYSCLSKKYNNMILQEKWKEYIDGGMLTIFNQHIEGNNSLNEMIEQFPDPEMKGYAMSKYMTFLEKRINRYIESNESLNTILNKYKNDDTKNLIALIFNDLKKNQQTNLKKESK